MKRILFLYTELAQYFLACCNELAKHNFEVHIVRWPVNEEAPFVFNVEQLRIYERKNFDRKKLLNLVKEIHPNLLVCSGWIDSDYLYAVKNAKVICKKVLILDNHWKNSIKQRLGAIYSKKTIVPYFDYAWVPGDHQKLFAQKMGFEPQKIVSGYYCADTNKFIKIYERRGNSEAFAQRKRFIYIGRYYDFKGIIDLWDAFSSLTELERNGWELWCLGTGSIKPLEHPSIKHFGFVQPDKLEGILNECSVFVLPSKKEPWGMVVHEMALAGFPMILSDHVGAAEQFLKLSENGYLFTAGDKNGLKKQLLNYIKMSTIELNLMSERSHKVGCGYQLNDWVEKIKNFV